METLTPGIGLADKDPVRVAQEDGMPQFFTLPQLHRRSAWRRPRVGCSGAHRMISYLSQSRLEDSLP